MLFAQATLVAPWLLICLRPCHHAALEGFSFRAFFFVCLFVFWVKFSHVFFDVLESDIQHVSFRRHPVSSALKHSLRISYLFGVQDRIFECFRVWDLGPVHTDYLEWLPSTKHGSVCKGFTVLLSGLPLRPLATHTSEVSKTLKCLSP